MNEIIDDWTESGATDPAIAALVPQPQTADQTPIIETQTTEPVETESTLEEHEDEQGERGRDGKFQKRHRARSQKASPSDVPLISEYSQRIKKLEAEEGADIKPQPGESPRVFELRRRAELYERRIKGAPTTAEIPAKTIASVPIAQQAPALRMMAPPPVKAAKDDPEPDAAIYDGSEGKDLAAYLKDHSRWAAREELRLANAEYEKVTTAETQKVEAQRFQADWKHRTESAKGEYSDFEAVAYGPLRVPELPNLNEIPQGSIIDAWILERPYGAKLLYHLKKNPSEFLRIAILPTIAEQVEELTLLGRALSKPVAAKPSNGNGHVPARIPAPPTPIKTNPMPPGSKAIPGDDDSLEAHEKAFYKGRRFTGVR